MKRKEVEQILKGFGITLTEFKKVYTALVKDAKSTWLENCYLEDNYCNMGQAPRMYAVIGYNPNYGLMKDCNLQYGYQNAVPAEWYKIPTVSILEQNSPQPNRASDYLYRDTYFQRTGKVSKKKKDEFVSDYPLKVKDFQTVVLEMIDELR